MSEFKSLTYTFPKKERLHSKKLIQELFDNGSSFYLYPFKIVWKTGTDNDTHQVLFSVSKRGFKRAVDRNLIKRRMREAYRLNKHQTGLSDFRPPLLIAYIYTGKEVLNQEVITSKLKKSLDRLLKEIQNAS